MELRNMYKMLGLSIVFMLTSCSHQADADLEDSDQIVLRIADSVPTSNYISSEGIQFFMERAEELSNGKVRFIHHPAEQLGTASSMLQLTQSKTVDIGYTSYESTKLPLSQVATLPNLFQSSSEGTEIYWQLVNDFLLEEEFLKNDVRPLWTVTLPPYQLITANRKVESLQDLHGLKLRVEGTMEHVVDELGAAPVSMPAPEVYTALERSTLDGAIFPVTSYEPYQLHKIANYTTSNSYLGSFVAMYSINEEVYQELPHDVQEALNQAGDEAMHNLSNHLDTVIASLLEQFEEDMEVYELDESTLRAFDEDIETVQERWVTRLEERGMAGEETLQRFLQIQSDLGYE